jgi:hypothetical protein
VLVRDMRLPRHEKNRPTMKGVLRSLADRANDEGRNCRPSLSTMAGEVEVVERTVRNHLVRLEALGLIARQAPPSQHRPRTYALNLAAIYALADPQSKTASDRALRAEFAGPDRQVSCQPGGPGRPATTLPPWSRTELQPGKSAVHTGNPQPQPGNSAVQAGSHVTDERLLNSLNDQENSLSTLSAEQRRALVEEFRARVVREGKSIAESGDSR